MKNAFLLAALLLMAASLQAERSKFIAYISSDAQFWPLAKVERAEIVFKDGFTFYVTSDSREGIMVKPAEIKLMAERAFMRRFEDIVRITHNHFINPTMSVEDYDFLQKARAMGFVGQYEIWCKGEARRY